MLPYGMHYCAQTFQVVDGILKSVLEYVLHMP